MEWLNFIELIAVPIAGGLMWYTMKLKDQMDAHGADLANFKVEVAKHYPTREEAERSETKVLAAIEKLDSKLERLMGLKERGV